MKISERINNVVEGFKTAKLPISREGTLQIILGSCGDYVSLLMSICEELGLDVKAEILEKISKIIPKKELNKTINLSANINIYKDRLMCILLAAYFIQLQEETKQEKIDTKVIDRLLNAIDNANSREYFEKLANLLHKYFNEKINIDEKSLDLLTIKITQGCIYNKDYLNKYLKGLLFTGEPKLLPNEVLHDMHTVVYAPIKESTEYIEYIELILGLSSELRVEPPLPSELCRVLVEDLSEKGRLPKLNELESEIKQQIWPISRPVVTAYPPTSNEPFLPVATCSPNDSNAYGTCAVCPSNGDVCRVIARENVSVLETPADVVNRFIKVLKK